MTPSRGRPAAPGRTAPPPPRARPGPPPRGDFRPPHPTCRDGRDRTVKVPHILQIVLGSDNLPFCKHVYGTALGFAAAGERLVYSEHNGRVMGLGPVGGATVLYMVGRQELLQFEFWTHTTPPQRPLPADWRPSDIGFCRLGLSVPDFSGTLARLAALGIGTITPPVGPAGSRRVCFRDPTVGVPVEVMEEGDGLPGTRDRTHDLEPALVYVAASVPNLREAQEFFGAAIGLEPAHASLHEPEHETLWGLPGARRQTALLRGGTVFLELVQYEDPAGRPPDGGLDRQGFKTIAVGFRDPADTGAIFRRVEEAGLGWTVAAPASHVGGNHVVGAVAQHMKTLSVPPELERQFGFSPEPDRWWRPPER